MSMGLTGGRKGETEDVGAAAILLDNCDVVGGHFANGSNRKKPRPQKCPHIMCQIKGK